MPTLRALYQDPYSPVLFNSPALAVTSEQKFYVKEVLDLACSDSRFAEKAYLAITRILTGLPVSIPTVTSLTPNSAEVGDPDVTLHVHGTNFTNQSKIVFNGGEEVTVYVSASELTTVINMATVSGPVVVPVAVVSSDGVLSDPMNFTFTDGSPLVMSSMKDAVTDSKKKEAVIEVKDEKLKKELLEDKHESPVQHNKK